MEISALKGENGCERKAHGAGYWELGKTLNSET
jgi:hypothetical protein